MSIKNPTLVHFRHFSSLLTNEHRVSSYEYPVSRIQYRVSSNEYMQNKPNFRKSQMNVNPYNTKDYENKSNWTLGENKPNSNPISVKAKMNVNLYVIKEYENQPRLPAPGKQTQSNPIPPTPVFTPKTNVAPKNNLKKPCFPLNYDNFNPDYVNHKSAIPA